MKLTATAIFIFLFHKVDAQDWHLAGNSDASATTSKMGTTNNIPLRLFTNNSERLRINTNGKVGIGTTSPIGKLTVFNNGSTPAGSWVSAGSPLFVGYGESTVGNGDYILSLASNTYNARGVFIGRRARGTLAAPSVVANNDFLTSFLASGYDGSAFQNPATIDFFVDGTPSAGNVPARISFVTGTSSSNRAERVKIGSTGNITFNNGQVYIQQATGNVGIGTTTPQSKLHFAGNLMTDWGVTFYHYDPFFTSDNQKKPWLRRNWNSAIGDYLMLSSTGNRSNNDQSAMILSQNGMFLGRGMDDGSGLSQEWIRVNTNGNVSIGTPNSDYKLNVNGTVRATELRVETGWADYVFDKGYKLRPLSEVAQYISQHNHLPGMASAKEIQKNGLAVGETQTKMMEKIEELTLYIIEQDKAIKDLKEQNASLQIKMDLLIKQKGK